MTSQWKSNRRARTVATVSSAIVAAVALTTSVAVSSTASDNRLNLPEGKDSPAPAFANGHPDIKDLNFTVPDFDEAADGDARIGYFDAARTEVTAAPVTAPTIDTSKVMEHLRQFQQIADNNGGMRAHGTTGQRQTVDYIKAKLDAAGYQTTIHTFSHQGANGYNLTAEWPYGNADEVIMVGAHTDSVKAGAGMNDNASGSAAILQTALTISEQKLTTQKRLRFGWWGAEELGLVGSSDYVEKLSAAERRKIKAYYNFDMVASPNPGYFVYDGDNSDGGQSFPNGSAYLEQVLQQHYTAKGIQTEGTNPGGRSDHGPFMAVRIPVGGIFTGAENRKSPAQVQKWGGTAAPFDPCYHKACDNLSNIHQEALDRNDDVIAAAVWTVAGVGGAAPAPGVDFTLAPTQPQLKVTAGQSVTTTINVPAVSGSGSVDFDLANLPQGVTAQFEPTTVNVGGSTKLTITTAANTPTGSYALNLSAGSGSVIRTATLQLTVASAAATSSCSVSESPAAGIADMGTVTRELVVTGCPGNASATSKAKVNITHTYRGDLSVTLVGPSGKSYSLHNRRGGSADNVVNDFTVDLSGETASGTWKLIARDHDRNDAGTLNSWGLDLASTAPGVVNDIQSLTNL